MRSNVNKSNASEAFWVQRLDQVQMGDHERLMAKAHLARAEAFATLLGDFVRAIKNLTRRRAVRPYQRVTTSFE